MITGTFTVETSDNAALPIGASVPLSIDNSVVDVEIVTTSTVTVTAIPTDTSSTSDTPPTEVGTTTADTPNEIAPGVPAADEPDTGPAPGEQLAADSTPPATA